MSCNCKHVNLNNGLTTYAGKKVSQLPSADNLSMDDLIPIVQKNKISETGYVSRSATVKQVVDSVPKPYFNIRLSPYIEDDATIENLVQTAIQLYDDDRKLKIDYMKVTRLIYWIMMHSENNMLSMLFDQLTEQLQLGNKD